MRKYALAFACIALVGVSVLGQSNRATRPRVAPTPTPTPIQVEIYDDDWSTSPNQPGRRPPVLQGDPRSTSRTEPMNTPSDDDDDVIRVETNIVTMPVSVLDRDGRFVAGLRRTDFQIFENGVQQEIGYFESIEQPFTVVLMIDVSPSTAFRIEEIQDAAVTFIGQLRENDRVMIVAFDQRVQVLTRPTNDRAELRNALRRLRIGNGTSLYVAVDQVIKRELATIQGRKAIVLFTDGVDTTSRRATYESSIKEAEESEALIYPIRYDTLRDGWSGNPGQRPTQRSGGLGGILGTILSGGTITMGGGSGGRGGGLGTSREEYALGRKYLEELARNSGGRNFEADSIYNLQAAYAGIAEELRRQYSIGYYPADPGKPGERKQIRVRVNRPNLVVRARNSYIVGTNESRFAGR
jgi:Ca-activated chloride channel homolog